MVIRVLPARRGGIYVNTGSCQHLVEYLGHEAREEGRTEPVPFFSGDGKVHSPEVVRTHIDANGEGVQPGKPRFHSVVIAPSGDELRHLREDPRSLAHFTRQVMANYAANFAQRGRPPVGAEDVVWYATLHRSRRYSGWDEAVQRGEAQSRKRKEGEQTHVHVIVSARDVSRSRSLHPDAGPRQFHYGAWLEKSRRDFEHSFGYRSVITPAQHRNRLEGQLDRLDRLGLSLDRDRIRSVGEQEGYSAAFWKRMGQVERGVRRGSLLTPSQAYPGLETPRLTGPDSRRSRPGPDREPDLRQPGNRNAALPTVASGSPESQPDRATGRRNEPVAPIRTEESVGKERGRSAKRAGVGSGPPDLGPLLSSLQFEAIPDAGDAARNPDEALRRRLKRRR